MNPSNSTDDTHTIRNYDKKVFYKLITSIDSISKDFPIALLNAMYQCEDYILLDENKDFIVNEKSFNYKSSFYLSFIANKDSLNNNYLQARKALHKSISQIKQEQAKELESHTISLSNLLHIHHNNCDIFTKDNSVIDIVSLQKEHNFHKLNTQIFLYSTLLQGSKEIESNPFFFGTLDNNNALLESKPIYHFIPKDSSGLVESMQDSTQTAESPNDSIDSTQTADSANDSIDSTQTAQLDSKLLGTLQIYLDSHTLTLLNYDVLKVA